MIVYVGLYLLLVFSAALKQPRGYQPVLYFWLLALIVFAGTREWTGCDFSGYLHRFHDYQYMTFDAALERPEALFALLNIAIINLGLDYMWLNVAASCIIFAGMGAFARRFERPVHFLALAFPILIVQLAMSGIRQAIALGLLLLAIQAFIEGKRILTAGWILMASQFHTTALIFLPLVLLIGRNPSVWTLVAATLVIAPMSLLIAGERVDTYQARYGDGDVESFGAVFRTALIGITAIFFELYRGRYRVLYPKDYPVMRLFSIFSLAVVAMLFVSTIAAHRLGYYVMPLHIMMLLRLPRVMSLDRRDPFLEAMPFLAYGLYITVWFSTSRHASYCYMPYDSYLF